MRPAVNNTNYSHRNRIFNKIISRIAFAAPNITPRWKLISLYVTACARLRYTHSGKFNVRVNSYCENASGASNLVRFKEFRAARSAVIYSIVFYAELRV